MRTEKGLARNRLSIINLWKIFDNLRRSLLSPTLLALLIAGWLLLPGSSLVYLGWAGAGPSNWSCPWTAVGRS